MKHRRLKTVLGFFTTADAMETERVMRENGIGGRLIPIPREMSAGCGMAWAMECAEYEEIPESVRRALPPPEQVCRILV